MPRLGEPKYFEQLIPDPVAVIIFTDKIIIARKDGSIVERELPSSVEDYDDMPEGHG
jgi:hypothetical protein